MNYKTCNSCRHSANLFSQHPCYSCDSNTDAAESREFNDVEIETTDAWEPSDETEAIIEHGFESGRRAGIEEVIRALLEAKT